MNRIQMVPTMGSFGHAGRGFRPALGTLGGHGPHVSTARLAARNVQAQRSDLSGRSLGYSITDLPRPILVGGLAAGLYFGSELLPTPWSLGAKIGGIGLGIFAIIDLMALATPKKDEGSESEPNPLSDKDAFSQITGSFVTPRTNQRIPFNWDYTYTVVVRLANPSNQDVSGAIELYSAETATYLVRDDQKETGSAFNQVVKVPKNNFKDITCRAKLMTSPVLVEAVSVSMELRFSRGDRGSARVLTQSNFIVAG